MPHTYCRTIQIINHTYIIRSRQHNITVNLCNVKLNIKSLSCVYAGCGTSHLRQNKELRLLNDSYKTMINLMLIDENVNDISCE